jgi:hypothetical protein
MKFFFSTLSSNLFNYILDISKNLVLSIYFLIELVITLFTFVIFYFESVILKIFSKFSYPLSVSFIFFSSFSTDLVLNIKAFYLNFLNALNTNEFQKNASDALIFVALFTFISTYFVTGSASVSFSNEGLWLSILAIVVTYFFYYLSSLEKSGKDAISNEIEVLKSLILKNSTLISEISKLENDILSFQEKTFNFLLVWFVSFESAISYFDSKAAVDNNILETSEIVNKIFNEAFHDYAQLEISRDLANHFLLTQDLIEEVVLEAFDTNLKNFNV